MVKNWELKGWMCMPKVGEYQILVVIAGSFWVGASARCERWNASWLVCCLVYVSGIWLRSIHGKVR